MSMKTSIGVIQELLKAGGPQLFQVLPCHFAFPIPALSAYQGQIALEQETTNEEIAQVQLGLCHKTAANIHPVQDSQHLKSVSWPEMAIQFFQYSAHNPNKLFKRVFSCLPFPSQMTPSLIHSLNLKTMEYNFTLIKNFKLGIPQGCQVFVWDLAARCTHSGLFAFCLNHLGKQHML